MNIKPYKTTTFRDVKIDFINSETEKGTIAIIFTFTHDAINKNSNLLKKIKKGMSPRKNITVIRATRQIIIDKLPEEIFFNHYPNQLAEMIVDGKIDVNMHAQHPLSHDQAIGDIRSAKRCNDKEKTIISLRREVAKLKSVIEKITEK